MLLGSKPDLILARPFVGLSTSHISPLVSPPSEVGLFEGGVLRPEDLPEYVSRAKALNMTGTISHSYKEPELMVRIGGSLAKVSTGKMKGSGFLGGEGGGLRGEVVGFSSASRRRLMRMIASLKRAERPVFVTLTYPDLFEKSPEVWKRDMDAFGKRMAREFPQAAFLWRIEFKERMSGLNVGEIAPHFHLLVYGANFRSLIDWVSGAWWNVVGSGNEDHLMAGSRVERIYSLGGVMRYVGKYIAKEGVYPEGWKGRAWGVIGRKNLPWAVKIVITLTDFEVIKLVRLGRKMIGAKKRSFDYGLTWIVNTERVLDYLEFLSDWPME